MSTVLGLVAAGIGIAVLPECYCAMSGSSVVSLRIASDEAESRLVLALKADNASRLLQRAVDVACDLSNDKSLSKREALCGSPLPVEELIAARKKGRTATMSSRRKEVRPSAER